MVFSSILFLLYFLPIVILIYFIAPQRFRNIVLLVSSIAFYAWSGSSFLLILLGTTLVDFYLVKAIATSESMVKKKLLLTTSLTITIGILAYFKYANFFIGNINHLFEVVGYHSIAWTPVLLPIGISFFSFQKLTYAVDVFNKKHVPFKNSGQYMLFIIMFPQLIAGPIIRFNEIVEQIEIRTHRVDAIFEGAVRFVIGLSKKVLIANVLSNYADTIFDGNLEFIHSTEAWLGLFAYTFQIYFDFSGYSDMAIGLGKIFGFTFPENFNSPYISGSITEFWRRWHITLGTWMRDYLYIPLGGNRVSSNTRLYFNLIFVFFISGLWHGASWNFVVWGIFHGAFLILDRLFLLNLLNKIYRPISILLTLFIVMLGWVTFRSENLLIALDFYQKLFDFNFQSIVISDKVELLFTLILAGVFSVITYFKWGQLIEKVMFYKNYTPTAKIAFFVMSVVLFMLSVGSLTVSKFNPFIYFRF